MKLKTPGIATMAYLGEQVPDFGNALFACAADIALADARPSGDNAFKIELARRIVLCALGAAASGTPDSMPALPGSPFSTVPGVRDVA